MNGFTHLEKWQSRIIPDAMSLGSLFVVNSAVKKSSQSYVVQKYSHLTRVIPFPATSSPTRSNTPNTRSQVLQFLESESKTCYGLLGKQGLIIHDCCKCQDLPHSRDQRKGGRERCGKVLDNSSSYLWITYTRTQRPWSQIEACSQDVFL